MSFADVPERGWMEPNGCSRLIAQQRGIETMRTLMGIILGSLLTIAAAYMHDTMATSRVDAGPAAATNAQIVNWDVAGNVWSNVRDNVKIGWSKLTRSVG